MRYTDFIKDLGSDFSYSFLLKMRMFDVAHILNVNDKRKHNIFIIDKRSIYRRGVFPSLDP